MLFGNLRFLQIVQHFLGIHRKRSTVWGFLENAALSGNPQMAQHFLGILRMHSDFWGSPDGAPLLEAACGYEASAISHE